MPPPNIPNGNFYLNRYLDTVGDGSGLKDIILNYADGQVGKEEFIIAPPEGETFLVTRLLVEIVDAGSFDAASYGNGITLTNGITLQLMRGASEEIDLLDGVPIKANADFGRLCYDVEVSTWGQGNEYLHARWSFFKAGTPGLYLHGGDSDKIVLTVNDDMSDLVRQYWGVQGVNLNRDQHGDLIR